MRDEDDPIVGEDWLGTPDAANYLGLSALTLYRLIDEGHLPAYKMGRVIRIKVSDLEAYIVSVRIAPGTLSHLYPLRDLDDGRLADSALRGRYRGLAFADQVDGFLATDRRVRGQHREGSPFAFEFALEGFQVVHISPR